MVSEHVDCFSLLLCISLYLVLTWIYCLDKVSKYLAVEFAVAENGHKKQFIVVEFIRSLRKQHKLTHYGHLHELWLIIKLLPLNSAHLSGSSITNHLHHISKWWLHKFEMSFLIWNVEYNLCTWRIWDYSCIMFMRENYKFSYTHFNFFVQLQIPLSVIFCFSLIICSLLSQIKLFTVYFRGNLQVLQIN